MVKIHYLGIPLYGLFYIDDIDTYNGANFEGWKKFEKDYEDKIEDVKLAIKWAAKNPDYDFTATFTELPFDNQYMYKYLCKLEASLRAYEAETA